MRNRVQSTTESEGAPDSVAHAPKIAADRIVRTFKHGKSQDELVALQDVSFEVEQGEFLSIIGPSGCGKTTLLRIIASLTPADSGAIRIDGRPVVEPGPERAMVFQHFGLYPWKTILDNVKFPLAIRKVPDAEATAAARAQLRRVGLAASFEKSHPHQLSGGMQQRVGLARALATDAEILLMDEPFGAIDAQTREIMQGDLSRLVAQATKTVVLVTHDIDEAVLMADRVLVLTGAPGRVFEIVDVDLPRPRWEYDVHAHPRYAAIRRTVWDLLRSQIRDELTEGREEA
ncbi:MAG: ATP-binding cassette domain-containing protein [Streptosporangiales bacterium]|nr:ATP-binding cassette domain-containing protein [Streptosporangiales bacterium]